MPDLFLSYSRKDSTDALAFVQRMRANGLDVWIDQEGIGGASSWSGEIADAIRSSNVYAVLLSPNAVESINVKKELSVAAELGKRLLPLELTPTELTRDFLYHLAGIQRVQITDSAGIRAVLTDAGLHVGQSTIDIGIPAREERKSLIVLPFQDLSPAKDNDWFAEGLVSELLEALSGVKALRVIDQRTSVQLSKAGSKPDDIHREMNVRYFIDGTVRKFGEQIKINIQLLDIVEGEYLWSHSFKGEFKDIFEIQETVAEQVLKGLEVHLSTIEQSKVRERTTENTEAKELFWRANRFFERHTREMHEHAAEQLEEAIALDPFYAEAHQLLALVYVEIYRLYDRTPQYLIDAETLALRALDLEPDFWKVYAVLCSIHEARGEIREAEKYALEYVEREPDNWFSHYCLGLFYARTQRPELAMASYETALVAKPDSLMLYWNICLVAKRANNMQQLAQWARSGVPYFARYTRLTPDDTYRRVQYASLLEVAGDHKAAKAQLHSITGVTDGFSLYNMACLASNLGECEIALGHLEAAVSAGFSDVKLIESDNDLQPIRETERYKAVVEKLKLH